MPTTALDNLLKDYRIIDCDSHFTEPPDLWTSRVPDALKSKVPVQRTIDGLTAWYLNDELWSGVGGNTIRVGRQKVLGEHIVQPFSDIDPAAWDPKARLALMDEAGIYAAVLYPNAVGFSSNHVFAIEDNEQRKCVLQTYNDFYVDIQRAGNGRLLPQAMLPIWDMDLTIAEMERMIDAGITGFTLSDKPELLGLPELPEPYFQPMWDLFNESGAVVNFHIGAGMRREKAVSFADAQEKLRRPAETERAIADLYWQSFGPQRRLALISTQLYMSNVRVIVNLCMSNLFDRYPNLKVVSAESGIGWVPFILESMEYQMDEMVTDPAERAFAQRRPTEYFREHIYVTFWFERVGPSKLIDDIGVNNVLVETDIPHPTCFYPGAREHFAEVLGHLDPKVLRRVLQDNAAELYRVAVDAE